MYRVGLGRSKCFIGTFILQRMSSGLEEEAFERAHQLARALNCDPSYSIQVINERKTLIRRKWNPLAKTVEFLREKFRSEEILENSEVLMLKKEIAEERFSVLQQIGFTDVTSEMIVRYPSIVSQTISNLRENALVPPHWDPLDVLLTNLKCMQDVKDDIREKLIRRKYETNMNVGKIHSVLIGSYLCRRLDCDEEKVLTSLKKHGATNFASLDILIDEFNCDASKLKKDFAFLKISPDNLRKILNSSLLAQMGVAKLIVKRPIIARIDTGELEQKIELFRSFGVTSDQLYNHVRILESRYSTIRENLDRIKTCPEIMAMTSYPRFLQLLMSKHPAKNLEKLKSAGHVAISVNMLLKGKIEEHIASSHDSCNGCESILYFTHTFGKSEGEVRKKLNCHPNWHRISVYGSQQIIEALLERGVSKEQLWNSLYIVLYDFQIVMHYYEGLKERDELYPFDDWTNHPQLLELVVYYIESETHFTGAGVYLSDFSGLPTLGTEENDSTTVKDYETVHSLEAESNA